MKKIINIFLILSTTLLLSSCNDLKDYKPPCDDTNIGDICLQGIAYNKIYDFDDLMIYKIVDSQKSYYKDNITSTTYYMDGGGVEDINFKKNDVYLIFDTIIRDKNLILEDFIEDLIKSKDFNLCTTDENELINSNRIFNKISEYNSFSLYETNNRFWTSSDLKVLGIYENHEYIDQSHNNHIIMYDTLPHEPSNILEKGLITIEDLINLKYPMIMNKINS
ncbi:hypothetical protein RJG79_06285 [Mycoplasmatota bacterium WC44]